MTLQGHSAIVRSLCFNPANDLILLSGGLVDQDIKVWNSETGKNFANLKGHSGGIYSIKMAGDGSFAVSVGTDKRIMLWDIRVSKSVGHIETEGLPDMNDVALSNSHPLESGSSMQSMQGSGSVVGCMSGFGVIGHVDGTLSIWNLAMR